MQREQRVTAVTNVAGFLAATVIMGIKIDCFCPLPTNKYYICDIWNKNIQTFAKAVMTMAMCLEYHIPYSIIPNAACR